MPGTISSVADNFSQLSVGSRRRGAPRTDPVVRLLHRFYEPIILLRILDPTRGAQNYTPVTEQGTQYWQTQWAKFLDGLSWVCDSRHGGDTVSSVGAESSPAGSVFWLASNKDPASKAVPHLKWVLKQLEEAPESSPQKRAALKERITARCVDFSNDKVKNYGRPLHRYVLQALKILENASDQSDRKLVEDLQELDGLQSRPFDLCSSAHKFPSRDSFRKLTGKKDSASSTPNVWSDLSHYIGRLGSWSKTSKILVDFTNSFPQYICGSRVMYLESVPSISGPAPDNRTNLEGALRRMFSQSENARLQNVQAILNGFKLFDVSARFKELYEDKNFRPRVHAELLLVEHFYHRNLRFVGNYRYIGCSKPSCYCCDLYIKCHPQQFQIRATHGNLWVNWRPPISPTGSDMGRAKHTRDILNKMIQDIRRDVVIQIESRAPPNPRMPDSTTGITTVGTGSQQMRMQNFPMPNWQNYRRDEEELATQGSSSPRFRSLGSVEREYYLSDNSGPDDGASLIVQHSILTRDDGEGRSSAWEPAGNESESNDEEVILFRGRGRTRHRCA